MPWELRTRGISGGILVEAYRKLSEDFWTGGCRILNKLAIFCIFLLYLRVVFTVMLRDLC